MLEHRTRPLLPRKKFVARQLLYAAFSLLILALSLGVGMLGYHITGDLPWLDSFLNASMILTGMGPVDHIESASGKLFSGLYAIFSGVAFLTFVGVLFAPVYHRFLHKFHLDIEEKEDK
ncbi:MAG TPA: hypothetical protein VGK71_08015 [Nitrospirota bacterium]|jgi:hypothetical protein